MSRLPPKGPSAGEVLLKIRKSSPLTNDLFEAVGETSLPVQVSFLRRHYGISQQELAAAISMRQAHYSRLERKDSDHRLSTYQKVAQLLRSRLIILPRGAKIVMPEAHGQERVARPDIPKGATNSKARRIKRAAHSTPTEFTTYR